MTGERNQPDRPSVEEKLAEFERKPEYQALRARNLADDEDELADAKTDQRLRKEFRYGARRLCVSEVWATIEKGIGTVSPTELEAKTGLKRKLIYDYRAGEIGATDTFFATLSDFKIDYSTLKSLPPLQNRALEGYRTALHLTRTGESLPFESRGSRGISMMHLIAVCMVLSDEHYRSILDECRVPNSDEWKAIASRIAAKLTSALDEAVLTSCHLTGSDLRQIWTTWAEAVSEVRMAIPHHKWIP